MSPAVLKNKSDGYAQSSVDCEDATLGLETLKASAQSQDSDATQLEATKISNETGDDAVITDLATLLIDKLFGKASDSDELIADSDESASEVLTDLASALSSDYKTTSFTDTSTLDNTSVVDAKPIADHVKVKLSQRDDSSAEEVNANDAQPIVDNVEVKLSQRDDSLSSDLSKFGQLMQVLAPSQFAMVATQAMRSNIVEKNSDLTTTGNTAQTTPYDVFDVKDDLDTQMDDIINEALDSITKKVAASKNNDIKSATQKNDANNVLSVSVDDITDNSTLQKVNASKNETQLAMQKATSDVNNALSDSAYDTVKINNADNVLSTSVANIAKTNFVAEQYQNLVDGGYALPLIHECLMLFEAKMRKKSDAASEKVNGSDVEIESSIVEEAMSAYASLSGISFPYNANIANPRYVASNDFANNGIDADGNTKYIVCNDLSSLFNYAYDPANSGNSDIDSLRSKLGGLYDQLCDFDPRFAMNITDTFDPQEFIKTFTDYVKYINENILTVL